MPAALNKAAYRKGRADGFQRGRQDGYQKGLADGREAKKQSAAQVPSPQVKRALVIAPGIIPSLEIGILQPFNALQQQGALQYELRLEGDVAKEQVAAADVVVFLRNVEAAALTYLQWAKELGKKTVYYTDDNFLAIRPTTPVGAYYATPEKWKNFLTFLKTADIVKVDSPYYGQYIRTHFNPRVVYFPGSVDFDWLQQAQKPEREDGRIVIGYEGTGKDDDFAAPAAALKRILKYYGGFVKLEFCGYVPASLADHPNVGVLKGDPDYRRFMHQMYGFTWDIGIAPLARSAFNDCKTNNKYREYAACRIPGVYSDSPVYTDWVKHGETGWLAEHTEEGWHDALVRLIEDPPLRRKIREQAWSDAVARFSVPLCAEQWIRHIF